MFQGISPSDSSNPRHCAIWRGFANRGIGVGATVKFKGTRGTIVECLPAARLPDRS